MRDTLTTNNFRDFRQRYEGTIGFFHNDLRKILVRMTSVSDRKASFEDSKGNEFFAYTDSGVEFEFIPVDKGFYNTFAGAVLLQRVPERQWHRGISPTNTQAAFLYKDTFLPKAVDIDLISDIFEDAVSIDKAMGDFLSGKLPSLALSKHFAVTNNNFYFYNKVVGTVSKTREIKLSSNAIEQEVQDLLRRKEYPFTLV